MRKELQTAEAFEKNLREEVSVSAEFDLPLAALALIVEGGWQEEDIRRALDALRAADLVALLPASDNLLIALPNTKTADARVVEERLREAVPKTTVGVALYRRGDTAEDLLERAQQAASQGGAENIEAT
jgi:ketosteroid isomerase-like protein